MIIQSRKCNAKSAVRLPLNNGKESDSKGPGKKRFRRIAKPQRRAEPGHVDDSPTQLVCSCSEKDKEEEKKTGIVRQRIINRFREEIMR